MKPFENVTVFIEFATEGVPDNRQVTAHVVETTSTRGGICKAHGDELLAGRRITDRQMGVVHTLCLAHLRGIAKRVTFRYHPLMGLAPEEYPIQGAA